MKPTSVRQFEAEFNQFIRASASRPAFHDVSDQARHSRIERGRASRWAFAEIYLGDYVSDNPASFHTAWERIARQNDVLHVVTAFRGAGKTTYFNLIDLVYRIVYGQMNFGVVASLTEDKATRIVARVLAEVTYNRKLAQDFGQFVLSEYRRSSKDFVVTQNGNAIELKAVSIGQDPRGLFSGAHRPDVARLDDIQSSERSLNPRFVEKTVEWITTDLLPALGPSYHCQVSATSVHDRDVVYHLGERAKRTQRIKVYSFPAVADGRPTWPARWPLRTLQSRRETMTDTAYNQEFLLVPKSLDAFLFSEKWIQYYSAPELPEQMAAVITWVDPSAKDASKNDYKAVVTVGANQSGTIYVLDAWIRRASVASMVSTMYQQYDTWNPTRMYYEDNGGQAILADVLTLRAKEHGYQLPAQPVTNTINKHVRIEQTLSTRIERGIILFSRDNPMQKLLIDQLLQFPHPSAHDDGPDALEGAVRMLIRRAQGGSLPQSALSRQADRVLQGYT